MGGDANDDGDVNTHSPGNVYAQRYCDTDTDSNVNVDG
jgi:hypothetical protein